jgi:hypothetical protein
MSIGRYIGSSVDVLLVYAIFSTHRMMLYTYVGAL